MTDTTNPFTTLSAISEGIADAVTHAASVTVSVRARRGPSASGIVLAPDLVLTADHVVDPAQQGEIRLGLPDGAEAVGTLAGRDPATDLAVIRVDGGSLAPAVPAGSEPRVGNLAVLVGRPGAQAEASLGLISGLGGPARTRRGGMLERYILVDAVMYPGFSGGPLVDAAGVVIGLNTSGLTLGGPSVAVPWDLAATLGQTIAQHGSVRRGYLGLGSQPVALEASARGFADGQERGLLVLHVAEGGPAASAGFLQGDILLRLDDTPISNADDLQGLLGPGRVGSSLDATVLRGGAVTHLQVTVGTRA